MYKILIIKAIHIINIFEFSFKLMIMSLFVTIIKN